MAIRAILQRNSTEIAQNTISFLFVCLQIHRAYYTDVGCFAVL